MEGEGPTLRSIETQNSIKKLLDKNVGNQKPIVDKKTQTADSELIEPNEIIRLKIKVPFKSSNLKDKTDYSCFDVRGNNPQNGSGLSTLGDDVADNDISC